MVTAWPWCWRARQRDTAGTAGGRSPGCRARQPPRRRACVRRTRRSCRPATARPRSNPGRLRRVSLAAHSSRLLALDPRSSRPGPNGPGRDSNTITKCTILANTHIIPALGARKLRDLSADDIDKWLAAKAQILSTRTLREVRSVLKRAITRAQARDKVKRNVVLLCDIPQGRTGRPSKSLTLTQAEALLAAAENTSLHAYIVLSLLTGARTEELRALTWSYVDLDTDPPFIMVWRSVRAGGDTKTRKSRRTLKLPQRCVDVLRDHQAQQEEIRQTTGSRWQDNDLVFPSRVGTPADASHVRRSFRKVVAGAGLDPHEWTPRELRHSFVSLLSDADVPIEQISRLVGHSSSTTTETVYRKQIRPVIVHGADVMDRIFPVARITMLSYSFSYSVTTVSRSGGDHMPSELVGVGRFELPASSSRTKRAAKLRYTPPVRNLSGALRDFDSLAETRTLSGTPATAHDKWEHRGHLAGIARYQSEQTGLRAAGEPGRGPG